MQPIFCRYLLILGSVLLFGCGNDAPKSSLQGDAPVKRNEFMQAFPNIKLPYALQDTAMARRMDTLTIGYKAFVQFVPDSVAQALGYTATGKWSVHPLGRIEKGKETYLLGVAKQGDKKLTALVLYFNEQQKFAGWQPLLDNSGKDGYKQSLTVNKEPTFTQVKEKKISSSETAFTRNSYAVLTPSGFSLIMQETNEDKARAATIINPIDTLPQTQPFSGDYVKDGKFLLSLRDGANENDYRLFYYFEKNADCKGEIKGNIKLVAPKKAVYQKSGDPCVIEFSFAGNEVRVKEQGNCGNYRGIKCQINDTYRKKKPSVANKGNSGSTRKKS